CRRVSPNALHDPRALQDRRGTGVSALPRAGPDGSRRTPLCRQLGHDRSPALLPGDGVRRPGAARGVDGTLAGPRGGRGHPGGHVGRGGLRAHMIWSALNRLFQPSRASGPSTPAVAWLEPSENPWGVRVLDVRPVTQTMLLVTTDPRVASNAVSYGS